MEDMIKEIDEIMSRLAEMRRRLATAGEQPVRVPTRGRSAGAGSRHARHSTFLYCAC